MVTGSLGSRPGARLPAPSGVVAFGARGQETSPDPQSARRCMRAPHPLEDAGAGLQRWVTATACAGPGMAPAALLML